jgi:hypothetical protein
MPLLVPVSHPAARTTSISWKTPAAPTATPAKTRLRLQRRRHPRHKTRHQLWRWQQPHRRSCATDRRRTKLPAKQAERSGKRECGGGSPNLPSASLPAVASRAQRKAGCAGGSPHLRLKNPEGELYSRNHSRVRERKCAWPSACERRRRYNPRQSGGLGAAPPTTYKCRCAH